jgi:DNA-binding CsgD family transcriptional regulator
MNRPVAENDLALVTSQLGRQRPHDGPGTGDTRDDQPFLHVLPIDQIYKEISSLVSAIGTDTFYDTLSRFFARAFNCNKRLVMRYSIYDRPAFVVNHFMTEQAVTLYLSGLYRIDPILDLARKGREPKVASLRSPGELLTIDEHYLSELFKMAFITDELALLLPTPGGVTIAVCCERDSASFSRAEIAHAEAMLPAVVSIHLRHLDEVMLRASRKLPDHRPGPLTGGAYLILDVNGQHVFASAGWEKCFSNDAGLLEKVKNTRVSGQNFLHLGSNRILHWEECANNISIAPDGLLIRLEELGEGPISQPNRNMIDHFCRRHQLTQRESDIVNLILQGLSNSKIAERLKISSGTVKNHRWRLYYKLDITTERELLLLFLSDILTP